MFTRRFWRDAAERMIATAAQAGILSIGQDVVDSMRVDAFRLDWLQLASFMAGGALLALLKGLAAARFVGRRDSASLDPEA